MDLAVVPVFLAVGALVDLLFLHFVVDELIILDFGLPIFRQRGQLRSPARTHEDAKEVASQSDVRCDVVAEVVAGDMDLGSLDRIIQKLQMFGNHALFLVFVLAFSELSLLDSELGLAFLLFLFSAYSVLDAFHECAEMLHVKQGLIVLEIECVGELELLFNPPMLGDELERLAAVSFQDFL